MIGKIYSTIWELEKYKHIVLILGKPDSYNYTVLPLASIPITNDAYSHYKIKLTNEEYSLLNLPMEHLCIYTNKQTTMHYKELDKEMSDLKTSYPDLFKEIMDKVAEFQQELQNSAFL